jgi:branched-chain amino acid transport system permease protein
MTGEAVLAAVLTTIALGILLRGAMLLVWGAQEYHPLASLALSNPSLPVAGARISGVALALVLSTAAVYAGLWAFLRFTAWGIRMRAAGQNPLLAAQRGVGLHGIYALAWALATFTGGLDSLLGALAGSLIVAAAEVLLIHYVDPLVSDVAPFVVLLAMLVLRPWGLFGTREELDRV